MNAIARIVALAMVTIPPLALAAAAEVRAETVGLLLLRLQENSAAPLIQHCVRKVPDLKLPLNTEYQRFRKKFSRATAPLRARISTNDELARPAPRALVQEFEAMDVEMLAQVQALDPNTYCPRLKENLANATVESIRKNMESAYAQYTVVARQRR